MKPRDMISVHNPETGTFGDCSRAVMASLLELACEDVPHFLADGTMDGNEFNRRINDWLRPMNLAFVTLPPFTDILGDIGVHGLHHEASGPSPRLPDYHHAVCGLDGQVTHDPHPARAGVAVENWGIFVVLDPSKPTGRVQRSQDSPDDALAPLELQVRYAEAAADDFSSRFRILMRTRGLKAAESYMMGMLIAAVSGCRVAFDDATVKKVLDAQMDLALPHEAADLERSH